eukprot:6253969-Amphidinium_carterae.1
MGQDWAASSIAARAASTPFPEKWRDRLNTVTVNIKSLALQGEGVNAVCACLCVQIAEFSSALRPSPIRFF